MITNPHYRKFLDKGEIDLVTPEQIKAALSNITGKNTRAGRSLLIALYYTGARPNEILSILGKDIDTDGKHITIQTPASKRGLPRKIYLPKNELTEELLKYARTTFPELPLFKPYISTYTRIRTTKKGASENTEKTDKLRYYFAKWFKGVIEPPPPPYFMRHNRFSQLSANGASTEQIRLIKGAKTPASVTPYIHLSSAEAKKTSKLIK